MVGHHLCLLHLKPPDNVVEANFTRATGGPYGQKEPRMSKVFVLDTNREPLNPVHPARARILLREGKAAVYLRFPFCIILKAGVEQPLLHPLRLKIDPGSKTTGLAVVNDANGEVVWAGELAHRGEQIKRAIGRDAEALELDVEELEERIAPGEVGQMG